MSFTRAHYDAQGHVKRLCGDDEPVTDGHAAGVLDTPLSAWPASPFPTAVLKFNAGALEWEDPRTELEAWTDARAERDTLLAASDWTVTRAVETGSSIPTAWSTYRQALRDITEQEDPFNIDWPTPPAE